MEGLLGNLAGNKGIAGMIGDQAGKVVEGVVEKVLNKDGTKETEEAEQKGGGFDIGNLVSAAGGKKDDGDAGGVMGTLGSFLK